jgi:hypothetical protein
MHLRRRSRPALGVVLAAGWALAGCTSTTWQSVVGGTGSSERESAVTEIYQRAEIDRTTQLELEVERLRADLREAEEAMVAIESGLRGVHGRADAVSSLAESRMTVQRAARNAPWSRERVREAEQKLEEAEAQFQEGHTATAVFFASRARRIAEALNEVAERVAKTPGARFVDRPRVNLRSGPSTETRVLHVLLAGTPVFPERTDREWVMVRTPSGEVGWVYASLLRADWSPSSDTTTQSLPASFAR